MNRDQVRGAWLQLRGELRRRWATVTGDEVMLLAATKDIFLGKLRRRTGEARLSVERQLDALILRVELSKRPRSVITLAA
ncbi:MAG: hypothetical protein Q8L48_38470 [Archangium sp.]|nr:hypothetical protein [Archangium sp.]